MTISNCWLFVSQVKTSPLRILDFSECDEGDPELPGVKILEVQGRDCVRDPVHVHEFLEIIVDLVSYCGFIEVGEFGIA